MSKEKSNPYRRWRKLAGLTQTAVAEKLGIRPQTVQKWEYRTSGSKPSSVHWGKLAELYHIPIEFFLEAEIDRDPGNSIATDDSLGASAMLLTSEERRLIQLLRDHGGRKTFEIFIQEMEKRARLDQEMMQDSQGVGTSEDKDGKKTA